MFVNEYVIKDNGGKIYQKFLAQTEPQLLREVLTYTRGNVLRASCLLGISRNTLRKKLFNYQINSAMYKSSQNKRAVRGNV